MFDAAKKKERPVYEFTLPEELVDLQDEHIKISFGLVKLDMDEEILSTGHVRGNVSRLAYNFARYALVEVDGRKINKADGEDERILRETDPIMRAQILEAYANISTATEGASKKLMASRKIKIG
jgi:hypothetical protein